MYFYEKLLKNYLVSSGLPLRDVGREIGVPATTLNDWLISGNKPHIKNLIRLSEWSGHSLPALLTEIDNPDTNNQIIMRLTFLPERKRQQVLEYINDLV